MQIQRAGICAFYADDVDQCVRALETWRSNLKKVPPYLDEHWMDFHSSVQAILETLQESALIALRESLSSPSDLVDVALAAGRVDDNPLDPSELHHFAYELESNGRRESHHWGHRSELALRAAQLLLKIQFFRETVADWKMYKVGIKAILQELGERITEIRPETEALKRAYGQFIHSVDLQKKVIELEPVAVRVQQLKQKQSQGGKKRAHINAERDRRIIEAAQQLIAAGNTDKLPANLSERFGVSADRIGQILRKAHVHYRSR